MRKRFPMAPYHGQTRVVKKFLWFPKICGVPNTCVKELRWLEKAEIQQTYVCGRINDWSDRYWAN